MVLSYVSCPEHVPRLLPMEDLESHMVGEYHERKTCREKLSEHPKTRVGQANNNMRQGNLLNMANATVKTWYMASRLGEENMKHDNLLEKHGAWHST